MQLCVNICDINLFTIEVNIADHESRKRMIKLIRKCVSEKKTLERQLTERTTDHFVSYEISQFIIKIVTQYPHFISFMNFKLYKITSNQYF